MIYESASFERGVVITIEELMDTIVGSLAKKHTFLAMFKDAEVRRFDDMPGKEVYIIKADETFLDISQGEFERLGKLAKRNGYDNAVAQRFTFNEDVYLVRFMKRTERGNEL